MRDLHLDELSQVYGACGTGRCGGGNNGNKCGSKGRTKKNSNKCGGSRHRTRTRKNSCGC
jgi:hypothetical protein